MRKLIICEHISLDGVIQQTPDETNFPYADWTAPYRSPAGRDALIALHGTSFDLLLGRRTYDLWSAHWPQAPAGNPWSDGMNGAMKHVVTHRPDTLAWGPYNAIGPDVAADVRRLKDQTDGPNLILWGSSTLASALLAEDLADELLFVVYPVVLGTGKRLFGEGTPARAFELLTTQAMPTGATLNTYKLAGPLKSA